jgi:hypothetical protein
MNPDTSASKPTLVFVPGAWHSNEALENVISQMEDQGYTTRAVDLVSAGGPLIKGSCHGSPL